MLVALLGAAPLFSPGCVTSRPQKLTFEEAFGQPSRPQKVAPRPQSAEPVDVPTHLRTELTTFALRTAQVRERATTGSAMPLEQQAHWARVLEGVEGFLRRPAEETDLHDVARAHAIVEAELQRDAQHFGEVPPALAERVLASVARLSERVVEVRRRSATAREEDGAWVWPIEPVFVTSLFGARVHPIHRDWRMHSGIDLKAQAGQQVRAAASGKVVRAGWNGAHGIQVEVEHANGLTTRYSHLSEVLVERGASVGRGDPVGLAGRSGAATGVHLHFEVWRHGEPTDPLDALVDAEPPSMSAETTRGAARTGRRLPPAAR